jgi:hypothetical protein
LKLCGIEGVRKCWHWFSKATMLEVSIPAFVIVNPKINKRNELMNPHLLVKSFVEVERPNVVKTVESNKTRNKIYLYSKTGKSSQHCCNPFSSYLKYYTIATRCINCSKNSVKILELYVEELNNCRLFSTKHELIE